MKPREPLHPDDQAFLQELAARPSALTPEQERQLERLMGFADLVAPRFAAVLDGALPPSVVGMLCSTLHGCLSSYPLVEPMFEAATSAWPPVEHAPKAPPWPQRSYELAMYRAGDASLFDFLLALSTGQPPPADVASLERTLFGAVAAFLTGALVAIERTPPEERRAALAASKKGRALLDAHLAALEPGERERLETVSLHLDRRDRHPTMDTLEPDDAKAHAQSMLQLGAWLARAVPSPFAVPPAR